MTVMQTTENDKHDNARHSTVRRFVPLLVVLAGLAGGYALGLHQYLSLDFLSESREMLRGYVAENPILAPLGFALLYALAVAFSFPAASILTLFAGFLFGWLLGGALVVLTAIAAVAAFDAGNVLNEYQRLQKLGVRFMQPPIKAGPVTQAVLDDTVGNLIQIYGI